MESLDVPKKRQTSGLSGLSQTLKSDKQSGQKSTDLRSWRIENKKQEQDENITDTYLFFLNHSFIEIDESISSQISLPKSLSVVDSISFIIGVFQKELKTKGLNYILEPNAHLWILQVAKKSGKPKTSFPSVDLDSPLWECNRKIFCLTPKKTQSCIILENEYRQSNSENNSMNKSSEIADSSFQKNNSFLTQNKVGKQRKKSDKDGDCFTCW